MHLTKPKLFFGILAFLVIVNLLVIFNIDFLYLRPILAFIFLITVPGLLIMLCFKIRTVRFWEYLVYTIGLSVAFIMFAGLFVNWTLPFLGITDKPLSLIPILICFDNFLILLWFCAVLRNQDLKPLNLSFPNFTALDRIFMIIPMFFPVLSILGAFLLNNHGPNYLTMIMLGAIAIYVFLLVLFREKLNENVFPWALWMISLSLLLTHSMRGNFISSTDASLEYSFYKNVLTNSYWDIHINYSGYNFLTSVNILPVIFSLFLSLYDFFILKLLFPLIFSITSIVLFILFRKYLKNIYAFISVLFFVFQPTITRWTFLPPKQEIAFLFFSLIILIFLIKDLKTHNKVLFIVFGFSMIISHYSTAFIAMSLFLILSFLTLVFNIFNRVILRKNTRVYFPIVLVLLLFIFGFLWYSQATNLSDKFIKIGIDSLSNLKTLYISNSKTDSDTKSLLSYIGLGTTGKNSQKDLIEYSINQSSNPSSDYLLSNYSLRFSNPSFKEIKINPSIFNSLEFYFLLIGGFISLLGLFYFLFCWEYRKINKEFIILLICFLLTFVLLINFPATIENYNLDRIYQQMLVLIAVCFSGWIGFPIFSKFEKYLLLALTLFLIFYLLIFSRVGYSFTGGENVQLRFENIGKDYDLHFVHFSEISSANWVLKNKISYTNLDVGDYDRFRVYQSAYFNPNFYLKREILPFSISREDYIYSSYENSIQKTITKFYDGSLFFLEFPTEFLNDNKNKIYSNGESEIFK